MEMFPSCWACLNCLKKPGPNLFKPIHLLSLQRISPESDVPFLEARVHRKERGRKENTHAIPSELSSPCSRWIHHCTLRNAAEIMYAHIIDVVTDFKFFMTLRKSLLRFDKCVK